MPDVDIPTVALKHGKRPSDAISISDDEEPAAVARSMRSSMIRSTRYASSHRQLSNSVPNSRLPLTPLTPSSTNNARSVQARPWKGWNKSACTQTGTAQNVVTQANDATGAAAPSSPLVDGDNPTQRNLSQTPQKQSNNFRRLTYWRRREGKFWTHELYRGPMEEEVEILYCRTRVESEHAARLLVNEPILGFDMEWKPRGGRGIKGNISLIQLACEDKIALFHIALHEGRTVGRLLAPTLRKILESPDTVKTGVAILHADGRRLQRFMKLKPRGLFELSYLHRLVKYYGSWPEKVNKQLVGLARQVLEHLGKPLFKGKVRVSDWTKPLDADQVKYSAADAYAGFRLFHAMEAKRTAMVPVPPRPAFAELDLPVELARSLSRFEGGCDQPLHNALSTALSPDTHVPAVEKRSFSKPTSVGDVPTRTFEDDLATKRALSALRGLRIRLSRTVNMDPNQMASDATLMDLAANRPRQQAAIQSLPGRESFSRIASQQGINLVDFLEKFAPEVTH
ncbi:MAG: hypothetical protein M1822_008264 [Bathelium mastoideum]|nr:MAG: hypothetical protein M1822_008264 [Bathelium mastoideum]